MCKSVCAFDLQCLFGMHLTVDISKIKYSSIDDAVVSNKSFKHDLQSLVLCHATGVFGIIYFEPRLHVLFSETKCVLSEVITKSTYVMVM